MHKGIKLATIIAFLLLSCATISAVSAANIYTITDDSYTNYFNASGYINDTNIISGDVLDCSGAINNKDMYIDRPLNITSSDKTGTIFNGTITILSSGSGTNVTDLVINNTNHNGNIAPGSIVIAESENNTIANNVVLTSQEGDDSYGVCLIEANNNQINGNTITTTGDGTGSAKKGDGKFTYGVYLEESSSNVFDSNTITTTGVSADVDWSDWLNGGVYPTTGVFLYSASDNNDFINNTINTDYNLIHSTTGYDTLLGVRIHQESCGNNFANNTINTNGFSYAYGVEIVGTYGCLTSSGNIISGNTISTVGDNYANGIKVSTYTEDTLVSGNDISATADNFAYGVYLENFGGSEGLKNVTVTGNNVLASADESYVLELYEARGHTITDNVFNGVGEDGCYGIHLMSASNSNNISGNNVTVNGDGITYGVYLEDSSSNIVDSNIVNTTGFAGDVDWSPYPDPGIYSTIGVFLYDSSNNNILTNNIINTDYNAISASGFDTMLGVRLCEDCNGNNLTGNTINTNGYSYGYGLEIVGAFGAVSEGNIISGNDISTVGKNYANGVKVSGYTKDTVISENDISAIADNFAYGLYLEDYGNNLQNVTATGNNVFASAIQAYVLDLYRATGHTILNNIFNGVGGDECYGIHLVESNANNLSGNNVTVNGDGITYGVYLDGSSSNVFDLNTIHTTGLAGDIDWSDYYMGGIYPTLGVFISNGSAQNNLTNNNITTDYNNISESGYDTILGVQIRNDCDENTLSGNIINTIGNNYAYGLEVVGGFDSSTYEYLECEGNVISDNTINTVGENHYANGIKVGAITPYTQISGNNVSATAPDLAYGIYLEGGFLGPLRYVSVNDNIIQTAANINYIIELYSASGSNLANGNQITNNMLTGVGNYTLGISTYQTKYNTITNNTITITGNNTAEHIPNGEAIPEGNDGIKLYYNSNNNIVNGNIINGSIVSGTDSSSGIHLHRSTGNTLEANTIDANSNFTNGMFLQNNSNENVVTNNIISGNVFAGIFVNGSSNNEINNNNILGNQGNGISVNASDNNTITNNDINNNGEDGINVEQSTGNGITDNEIYENQGKGISTTNAEDNTHENNNIHDNGESVEVNSADPANNAVNVPCNKVINITFSDSIKAVNMSIQLTNSGGTVIPTTTAINNNILTITPTTLLIKGTQYILTLNAGSITDLVGNPLASYTSVFTATTDSTVPKPTAGSPARNAVNVAVSRVITTTFNEDIVVANAAGVRLVSSSGTVVPVTVSVSGKVLSVTPTSALNRATKYTLVLAAGSVTDLAGNPISAYSRPFTTDNTAPKATRGSPGRNAVNVAVNRVITTTFNENIVVANAAGVRLVSSSGTVVPVTVSVSGKVLSVTPTSALNRATKYTLVLAAGSVTDLAGNPISAYSRPFTTDNTAPKATRGSPGRNAVNVAVNRVITTTFNENIVVANAAGVRLVSSSGTVVPVTVSVSGKVLSVTPTSALNRATKYTLVLAAGSVTDLAGNPVKAYSRPFTTDGTGPKAVRGSPGRNAVNVAVNRVITTTFNEDIVVANAAGIRLVSSSGTVVPVTISTSGKVLTVTPNASLNAKTKYTLVLAAGSVTDVAGNPVAAYSRPFTTGTG